MKRLLLIISLLGSSGLVCAGPAFAAPAWVRSNGSFTQTSSTVATQTDALSSSTAGNTVVAFVSWKTVTATVQFVCGGASCSGSTSTGKFFPYTWAFCSASTCTQIWICRNCAAITSATVTLSANSVFATQFQEYSGALAIGQIVQATGTSANPSVTITTQDANNIVVMASSSLGNDGIPASNTGNLRSANRTGSTSSHVAGAACDNTAVSAGTAVTCKVAITSSVWAALGVELRSATATDSVDFVEALENPSPSSENVAMPAIAEPLVADPILSGNTAVCWAVWPEAAGQGVTVTSRNSMSGSTVDTFTKDKQVDDAAPNSSLGIFRVAPTAGVKYINWAFSPSINSLPMFTSGCAEFKGITTSSPVDGTPVGASAQPGGTISAPAMTVTVGDKIIAVAAINTKANNMNTQNQGTSYCAPGPGWTLLLADDITGVCAEYEIATSTSVTPSLYMIPAASATTNYGATYTFNIAAVAYKASAGQGTAASGINITRQLTPTITGANGGITWIQSPQAGNFNSFYLTNQLSGTPESNAFKFWDSNQVAYSLNDPSGASPMPFLLYSGNATLDNSGMVELWQNATNGSNSEILQRDIANVVTSSFFDTLGSTCPSPSSFNATGCGNAGVSIVSGAYTNVPNIQPGAAGELVLGALENGTGPEADITSPTGASYDCPYFTAMTDASSDCYGEGHMHYYTTGTSALTMTYTAGTNAAGGANGSAIAIKAAAAGGSANPSDSVTSAPAVVTQVGRNVALSDSSTSSPSVNASAGRSAAISDSSTSSPAISIQTGKTVALSEASASSPAVVTQAGRNVAIADSSASAPAVATQAAHGQAIADTQTTSPSLATSAGRSAAISDSVTTSPALAAQQGRGAPLSDSSTSAPAVAVQAGRNAAIADASTSSAAIAVLAAHSQGIGDSQTSSPVVAISLGRSAALADASTTAPVVSVQAGKGAPISDSVTTSAALSIQIGRGAVFGDSVTSLPAVATQIGRGAALTQGVTSADSIAVSVHRGGQQRRVVVISAAASSSCLLRLSPKCATK